MCPCTILRRTRPEWMFSIAPPAGLRRSSGRGGGARGGVRRPLIMFAPKRMLRPPRATSPFAVLTGGFRGVLDDTAGLDTSHVARVVFCTGQVFYDLTAAREEQR